MTVGALIGLAWGITKLVKDYRKVHKHELEAVDKS